MGVNGAEVYHASHAHVSRDSPLSSILQQPTFPFLDNSLHDITIDSSETNVNETEFMRAIRDAREYCHILADDHAISFPIDCLSCDYSASTPHTDEEGSSPWTIVVFIIIVVITNLITAFLTIACIPYVM